VSRSSAANRYHGFSPTKFAKQTTVQPINRHRTFECKIKTKQTTNNKTKFLLMQNKDNLLTTKQINNIS
jgi:hypothetical protein